MYKLPCPNLIIMSEHLPHLIPLQGELHALTHLLLYHTNWSESGNPLADQAIFIENTETLSNKLRKLSEKPLEKTLLVINPFHVRDTISSQCHAPIPHFF